MVVRMKRFLQETHEPLAMHYRVNAGPLPADHWINDREQGGGRILGEVCHFVDLMSFLAGSSPMTMHTRSLSDVGKYVGDNLVIAVEFQNGSQGTITYVANGDRGYSKERLEVFGGGSVAVLEDFRQLELARHAKKQVFRSRLRQDKGHRGEWQAFAQAVRTGSESPIPFSEIVNTTLATIRAEASRACGQTMPLKVDDILTSHLRAHLR
jgi:predicted dehydrogenase